MGTEVAIQKEVCPECGFQLESKCTNAECPSKFIPSGGFKVSPPDRDSSGGYEIPLSTKMIKFT